MACIRNMKMFFVGVVLTLIGFLAFSCSYIPTTISNSSNGKEMATAVVTNVDYEAEAKSDTQDFEKTCVAKVSYDADGIMHENVSLTKFDCNINVGDIITIVFDTDTPEIISLVETTNSEITIRAISISFMFMGVITVIGYFFLKK